jgi:hypothetical protein
VIVAKEMEPNAFGSMVMKSSALSMLALEKHARKGVIAAEEASVDGVWQEEWC